MSAADSVCVGIRCRTVRVCGHVGISRSRGERFLLENGAGTFRIFHESTLALPDSTVVQSGGRVKPRQLARRLSSGFGIRWRCCGGGDRIWSSADVTAADRCFAAYFLQFAAACCKQTEPYLNSVSRSRLYSRFSVLVCSRSPEHTHPRPRSGEGVCSPVLLQIRIHYPVRAMIYHPFRQSRPLVRFRRLQHLLQNCCKRAATAANMPARTSGSAIASPRTRARSGPSDSEPTTVREGPPDPPGSNCGYRPIEAIRQYQEKCET